jgi:multidrug efflux pump subunit AcrA (membrane-fusion protein)
MVPKPAVVDDGGQTVVFVVEDETLERRAVSVGRTIEGNVEILAGVIPGDRVVVSPLAGLTDGQRVRVES